MMLAIRWSFSVCTKFNLIALRKAKIVYTNLAFLSAIGLNTVALMQQLRI